MRAVLSMALLLVFAGSAQAQQAQFAPSSNEAAVEARLAPAPAQSVQNVQVDVKPIHSSERRVADEARNSVVAEEALVRQDPTTRSWWWLVGAIVVAGIILAVIR
jgi:hypothetical protein